MVNSDDPAYFGGYLNKNLTLVQSALNLSIEEIKTLIINSFESSFLDDIKKKNGLIKYINEKIKILIPVYNDWQSVFRLLENINSEVSNLGHEFSIIIVNDASTESKPGLSLNLVNLNSIKIINMKENRGHARCNAAGLKHIFEKEEFDYVIPMDGDGEDRPEEIKQLVDNLNYHPDKPIVGQRIKRSEGAFFKFCYFAHKLITSTFTGQSIKYGNYTCLPKSIVEKMINEKATWSSFSGSLAKVAKDRATIPSERGIRYFSPSKMSFKNLLIHSLSIVSVFKINVLIDLYCFY